MAADTFGSDTLAAEVITSPQELQAYSKDWNEVLSSSRSDTIFLTWEWISTWIEAVYPDVVLYVVVVRDGSGRLIAVAPFYLSELHLLRLLKYRCLRILGDCQSGAEYGDVIIRRGFESAAMKIVIEKLMEHRDFWDCLWIRNVAGWTGAYERFSIAAKEAGLYMHKWTRKFSAVALPDTHKAYLALFSKKRRGYLKRETKRLHSSHPVDLIRCENHKELSEHLSDLFELHRKHWESVGQHGSFVRRPLMRRFYESFAPKALHNGWLRLYVLEIDSVPEAAQYGYVYNSTYYALQEGYDPHRFSGIGNVLRNLVFQKCIEDERLKEYDFLGGYTQHKAHWRAEVRNGYDLLLGRQTLKNHVLFWKKVSPTGRFMQEGRPANEGCSHD